MRRGGRLISIIAMVFTGGDGQSSGPPNLWSVAPFVGLLLAIAILPLPRKTAHWWESNRNRLLVSLAFAAMTLAYYFAAYGGSRVHHLVHHTIRDEYLPFIILLFSLYVISGGISIRGDLAAHPFTNTIFLAIGAVLASCIGTTGASMLLIRPLLQTNSERKRVVHTFVFFIFIVSNVGGSLLPIGDPPLFLGYLQGVPFFWTLVLWKEWLICTAALLAIHFVWDCWAYRRETPSDIARDETQLEKLRMRGGANLIWLILVVACVAVIKPGEPLPFIGFVAFPFMRELALLALVGVSLMTTDRSTRIDNQFNYHAILEVAALFIGIFITMQAPLEILGHSGDSLRAALGSPAKLFWATGGLSSFLDNAPTYLVFLRLASVTTAPAAGFVPLQGGLFVDETALIAISLGAVFMGAMTYIGNGPNFMVKSIAEQGGVKMPSFFGYMGYTSLILVPLFLLLTLLFF
jgi:Na+/H+ antiporter NhaD/arsenite permease-like protein